MPDRVFFACGACHILAYAFLTAHPNAGYRAVWLKPADGDTGNHVIVTNGTQAFDYHGYTSLARLLAHTQTKARRWWPGWRMRQIDLPTDVLISEVKSKTYPGLWLREPDQFLHDALPRARAFLTRFPPPDRAGDPFQKRMTHAL